MKGIKFKRYMDSEFSRNTTKKHVQIHTYKGKYNMRYSIICIICSVVLGLPN